MAKKLVHIQMTEELHRLLKIRAAENSTTMAGVIEDALKVYDSQNQSQDSENIIVSKSGGI
jgi:hypothetical protein